MYGIIYYALNTIKDKVYVGQTVRELKKRINEHYLHSKNIKYDTYFDKALRKYSKDVWEWNMLDVGYCEEELTAKEDNWMMIFDSLNNKLGYNTKEAGSNGKPNKEIKRKMSLSAIGRKNSEEMKQKIRETLTGSKRSDKTKKIMSEQKMGAKNPNAVKVLCVESNKIYGCITEAGKKLNINRTSIIGCCRKNRKTAGGFHWKYVDGTSKFYQFKKNKQKKIIFCVENNEVYESVIEASRKTNISNGNISSVLTGKRKTAGKLHWEYVKK